MLNELIFKTGYLIKRPQIIKNYNIFCALSRAERKIQINRQEEQLVRMINFSYKMIPYYKELFDREGVKPGQIRKIVDLEKIPILTKSEIKKNWDKFIPNNINKIKFINGSTGGSTGAPLKYRMAMEDYEIGVALLYRGWSNGGYMLGDKVAVMGGGSLVPDTRGSLTKKIHEFYLNYKYFSSYEISEEKLSAYLDCINKWKPSFIRGYASTIYLFAKFIKINNKNLTFSPKAVFTTSEMLFQKQREFIENIFRTTVFNNYGLNDGGVSAFECETHNGMHIDTERSILEIVDSNGCQITEQMGKIIATNLYNYAMPFIRYETGDMGLISEAECHCGRKSKLLKEISGRTTDYLKLNNIIIGSPVLTVLMGRFDIEQYQIIQEKKGAIVIKIIPGTSFDRIRDERYIKKSFQTHVGSIEIKFDYVDVILTEHCNKHKFIINYCKD